MDKYQRGKIYTIICRKTGRKYVGSTCEPTLAKRLAKHVVDFKCWSKNKTCYKTSFDIIKDGDYFIVLLESYPCNSRDELRMCEQKHIDLQECVNKFKAFRSEEERVAKQCERVCCPTCQKEISKSNLSRHKNTCPQLKKEIVIDVI